MKFDVNKVDKPKEESESEARKEEIDDIKREVALILKDRDVDPEFIKKHPPVDGYMGSELKKAELKSITPDQTELVEPCLVLPLDMVEPLPEGEFEIVDPKTKKRHKLVIYDTVFRTDLRALVQSQFYECPATTFPTIAERLEQTARNERDAKYPEKRSDKKDYWWLYLLILIPVLIIIATQVKIV